jgi:hypothetical protein
VYVQQVSLLRERTVSKNVGSQSCSLTKLCWAPLGLAQAADMFKKQKENGEQFSVEICAHAISLTEKKQLASLTRLSLHG